MVVSEAKKAAEAHNCIGNATGHLFYKKMIYLTDGLVTDAMHVSANNPIAGYKPVCLVICCCDIEPTSTRERWI